MVLSISRALPTRAATASRVDPLTRSAGVKSVAFRSSRYSGSIPAALSSASALARAAAGSCSPPAIAARAAPRARGSAVARFETYTISGERGSGEICINGAAARLVHTGDTIIVISYAEYSEEELESYLPRVVHVNKSNEIVLTDATVRELLA